MCLRRVQCGFNSSLLRRSSCVNICQPLPALRGGEIHEHTELHGTAGEKRAFAGLNSFQESLGANHLHDPFLLGQKAGAHQELKSTNAERGQQVEHLGLRASGFCIPALSPTPCVPRQAPSPPPRTGNSGAQTATGHLGKIIFICSWRQIQGGAFILQDGAHLVHQCFVSW